MEARQIKVAVRIRPVNNSDFKQSHYNPSSGPDICMNLRPDGQRICLIRDAFSSRDFCFDHVFATTATTASVYRHTCEEIVNDYLCGYNASILCYGQTGTGKTFTMFGRSDKWNESDLHATKNEEGILLTSLHKIFDHVEDCKMQGKSSQVSISFYEIYLETVRDLLVASERGSRTGGVPSLNIRECPDRGTFVEGLSVFSVRDMDAVYDLIRTSVAKRATHELSMNKSSSRSHAILQVTLEKDSPTPSSDIDTDEWDGHSLTSKSQRTKNVFTFCDLAGSERVTRTGSTGARLSEAKMINKSISALGNCIQALASAYGSTRGNEKKTTKQRRPHIPFRDSKLTRLLADAIGGNSRTCIIATTSPCAHSYEESLSTLIFASRAASIKKVIRPVKATPSVFSDLSSSMQEWKWPPAPPSPAAFPSQQHQEGEREGEETESDDDSGNGSRGGGGGDNTYLRERRTSVSVSGGGFSNKSHRELISRIKKREVDSAYRQNKPHSLPTADPVAYEVTDYTYSVCQEEVDPNVVEELSSSRLHRVQYSLHSHSQSTKDRVHSSHPNTPGAISDLHTSSRSKSPPDTRKKKLLLHPSIVLKRLGESVPSPSASSPTHDYLHHEEPPVRISTSQFMAGHAPRNEEEQLRSNLSPPRQHRPPPISRPRSESTREDVDMESEKYGEEDEDSSAYVYSVQELAQLSTDVFKDSDFGVSASTKSSRLVEQHQNQGQSSSTEMMSVDELSHPPLPTPTQSHQLPQHKSNISISSSRRRNGQSDRESAHSERDVDDSLMLTERTDGQRGAGESRLASSAFSTKVTISRDAIPSSRVPPPPPTASGRLAKREATASTSSSRHSLDRRLHVSAATSVPQVDHCTVTDVCAVEYVDKETNTPLATLSNQHPCPNCRSAQAEILFLKNEICRYMEDINLLKGL